MEESKKIFEQRFQFTEDSANCIQAVSVPIEDSSSPIELRYSLHLSYSQLQKDWIDKHFNAYIEHPQINPSQVQTVADFFDNLLINNILRKCSLFLYDRNSRFVKRCGFPADQQKSNITLGDIDAGNYKIFCVAPILQGIEIIVDIELWEIADRHADSSSSQSNIEFLPFDEEKIKQEQWVIAELHESTSEHEDYSTLLELYQKIGYSSAVFLSQDGKPLQTSSNRSRFLAISGQEVCSPYGKALLIGVDDFFPWFEDSQPIPVEDYIHQVHSNRGLFCISEPFACPVSSHPWIEDENLPAWRYVDLLEIWTGDWSYRFPEIMKAMDLWDALLNQGYMIYGICGKTSTLASTEETLEQLPKMLVLTDRFEEDAFLGSLKMGHCYATIEPAITFWVESEHGSAKMGDQLRIPVNTPYLLQLNINQLPRSFVRIKTNSGIFCEMPLASTRDTSLQFMLHASEEMEWFRVEVYRYGRPIDQLLALSNPIFIQGMVTS